MSEHKITVIKGGSGVRCSPLHSDECKSHALYDHLFTSRSPGANSYKKGKEKEAWRNLEYFFFFLMLVSYGVSL